MSDDRHEVTLFVEDGGANLALTCRYDPADETRPCWPHDFDGNPDPPPQTLCTYEDWVEAVDLECVAPFIVPLRVVDVNWASESLALAVEVRDV